jgi:hypothetical protein
MVLGLGGAWVRVRLTLAITLCVSAATALLAWLTRFPATRGTDYFYYYCVSKLVAAGHGGSAYDDRVLGALERHLLAPHGVPGGVIPNVYPPFFAVALAPLTLLGYTPGSVLWTAVNCVAFGGSLAFLIQLARLGRLGGIGFGLAGFVALPALVALMLGQASFVLLALLCIVVYAATTERQWLCGSALALMLIKPQLVLPFLVVLVVRGQWQAISAFAIWAAVLAVAPLLVLGPGAIVDYIHALLQAAHWGGEVGGFSPADNLSIAGFLRLLLPGAIAMPISIVMDVAALVALAVLTRRPVALDALLALTTVIALLISQHVLIHDLTLLLVPAAVVLRHRAESNWRVGLLWALGYVALFVGFRPIFGGHIQILTVWMAICAVWLTTLADFSAAQTTGVSRGTRDPVRPGVTTMSRVE